MAALRPRCTFPVAGTPVVCAVSGGADSLALLVLAVAAGCDVCAVHVDHGLRPGSAAEADVVRAAAENLGARVETRTVSVPPGPNLEARARAARRAVLPPDALTGHTADDRAETMLLNLLRGAGAAGLSALGPSPRRPILGLRRTDTEALCRELRLEPVLDPTNADPRFRRNRVRAELLPLMADIAERDVVPLLLRSAAHVERLDAHVSAAAASVDPTDVTALRATAPVVAATALRSWLRAGNGLERHPPDQATIARVLDVVAGRSIATDVGGGRRVRRSVGRLILENLE